MDYEELGGLQEDTCGYKGLKREQVVREVTTGYRGLQKVGAGYIGLQGVTHS